MSVRAKDHAQIARLASQAFASHQTTLRFRDGPLALWRCQRPGTWHYGFDVTLWPGHLAVTGDVGDLVVARTYDMTSWARAAVLDIHYFAEKAVAPRDVTRFSQEAARELIAWHLSSHRDEDAPSRAQARKTAHTLAMAATEGEHAFCEAYCASDFYNGDPISCTTWDPQFLWCFEAVRWWLSHHLPVETGDHYTI